MASNAFKNARQLRPNDTGMTIDGRLELSDIIKTTVDHTPIRKWSWTSDSNYSQSDSQYETPTYAFTPIETTNKRFTVTAWGNCRYLENTDDTGVRMYVQYYNSSNVWTTIGSSDNYAIGRYADRGSSNYLRATLYNTFEWNIASSMLNGGQVKLRQVWVGHGGTSGDDLDLYLHGYEVTEKAYW